MSLVAAMVSSHGVVEKIIPLLVQPKNGANPNNNWFGLFAHWIPQRLVPWNPGDANTQIVADAWTTNCCAARPFRGSLGVPVLNWGLLIFLVLFAFLCLTAILRRQWVDGEKLAFPLAQLPLEIAGDQDRPRFSATA